MTGFPSASTHPLSGQGYSPREVLENQINTATNRGRTSPPSGQEVFKREIDRLQEQYKRLTGTYYTVPEIRE